MALAHACAFWRQARYCATCPRCRISGEEGEALAAAKAFAENAYYKGVIDRRQAGG